jgi:DNA-binding transcriptional regulator YhcF (GntR family)
MPRKTVSRLLPPLPDKGDLDDARHKTERLTEILRKVAMKNQRTQPRAFYSVRDVAGSFHVTLSTVARAYRALEQEGLLTRVRGSRTLLQGRHFDRRLEVRAFVGLPASLSSFVTIQAYRSFFIKIRRELRLRGFATAMVFFEKEEVESAVLSERLKTYEVDTVIWFQPPREAAKTSPWLSDLGIRLIGVAHEEFPSIPCRYHVRRGRGIADLLAQWKERCGIDHVTLAQPEERRSSTLEESLHNTLNDLGLKWSVAIFDGKRSEDFVRALQNTTRGGIIFSSSQLASQLCFRTPNAVADLLQIHRVALLNGPVSMPFARVPRVKVDLVVVDWQHVAEKIVDDLITQEAFQQGQANMFEAEAKLRVPLSEFAHSI